jgi:1-deoxy-D-xylulose-5-phosphate reductoisomerase
MTLRYLTILGSTGSIGTNTLDVVSRHPNLYAIHALTAHSQWEALAQQCVTFQPLHAVIGDATAVRPLTEYLRRHACATQVHHGVDALCAVAGDPAADTVIAAIVGAAGLLPTLTAASTGKRILLANKEVLVCAGALFMRTAREAGATVLPLDSEHNAIFQCLPTVHSSSIAIHGKGVKKLILTASGGPFLKTPLSELPLVTPAQAVKHPNWTMGQKISVDSATMMNKGLEVIEAHWLFDVPSAQIDVVVHPQSIVHSMVEYLDGSTLAQMGTPDMRTPIANALAWPERIASGSSAIDWMKAPTLTFEPADLHRFPCLRLAIAALNAGGCVPAQLNAANEVAVEAFLQKQIRFTDIAKVVENTLMTSDQCAMDSLEDVLEIDGRARAVARDLVAEEAWTSR